MPSYFPLGDRPKVTTVSNCDFPIVEGIARGFKVLKIPQDIRDLFDRDGFEVVRIESADVAKSIPNFGGKTSGEYSLLPHQDHFDPGGDERRFLMLTQTASSNREALTVCMAPLTAAHALEMEEAWIQRGTNLLRARGEEAYDPRFAITLRQYERCFEGSRGYEEVLSEVLGNERGQRRELCVRLGIIGFMLRGTCADEVMEDVIERLAPACHFETWEKPGVLIIDNRAVFHGRYGGNDPPLQRNYGI